MDDVHYDSTTRRKQVEVIALLQSLLAGRFLTKMNVVSFALPRSGTAHKVA